MEDPTPCPWDGVVDFSLLFRRWVYTRIFSLRLAILEDVGVPLKANAKMLTSVVIENITRAKDSLRRDVDFARSCQAEFNSIEQLLGNLKRRLRESCESPGQIIENELSMLREGKSISEHLRPQYSSSSYDPDSSSKAQKRKLSQFQRWVTDQDIEVLLGLLSTVIEERDDRELDYEELLLSESLLASAIGTSC